MILIDYIKAKCAGLIVQVAKGGCQKYEGIKY
jgi:hypothetical protein